MNKLWLPALAFFLSACSFTPKPYISDEYQKYKVSDLKVPERPHVLKLETEFTRNGKPLPAVRPELTQAVNQALNETKVAVSVPQSEATLKIYANNIVNMKNAIESGIGTGVTFGLAGNTVRDDYTFICSYSHGNQELSKAEFDHAIVSNIGARATPIGLIPQKNLQQAFFAVTKDVVVNCLGDLQKKGYLLP